MNNIEPTGRIVIAGGTGFLGLNLARYLGQRSCEVILLSRHSALPDSRWRHVTWDARATGDWVSVPSLWALGHRGSRVVTALSLA